MACVRVAVKVFHTPVQLTRGGSDSGVLIDGEVSSRRRDMVSTLRYLDPSL